MNIKCILSLFLRNREMPLSEINALKFWSCKFTAIVIKQGSQNQIMTILVCWWAQYHLLQTCGSLDLHGTCWWEALQFLVHCRSHGHFLLFTVTHKVNFWKVIIPSMSSKNACLPLPEAKSSLTVGSNSDPIMHSWAQQALSSYGCRNMHSTAVRYCKTHAKLHQNATLFSETRSQCIEVCCLRKFKISPTSMQDWKTTFFFFFFLVTFQHFWSQDCMHQKKKLINDDIDFCTIKEFQLFFSQSLIQFFSYRDHA